MADRLHYRLEIQLPESDAADRVEELLAQLAERFGGRLTRTEYDNAPGGMIKRLRTRKLVDW